jgi:hypothetical protein
MGKQTIAPDVKNFSVAIKTCQIVFGGRHPIFCRERPGNSEAGGEANCSRSAEAKHLPSIELLISIVSIHRYKY